MSDEQDTQSTAQPGVLYLVPTPLGDVRDMSPRAVGILVTADIVAAEDTRTAATLLRGLSIEVKRLVSYHDHNEQARAGELVADLEDGRSVAVISEAGTPVVSDPGYRLAALAVERGLRIVALPGPSAPLVALTGSALPSDRFIFLGFPPRRASARVEFLRQYRNESATLIFFEAPHRMLETLESMEEVLGQRRAVLGWNLTRANERYLRGTLGEITEELRSWPFMHGQITLVVAGAEAPDQSELWEKARTAGHTLIGRGLEPRFVRDMLADLLGLDRKELYRELLRGEEPP